MAVKRWSRLFGTTFVAAFVLAAMQLGVASGLRIVDWAQVNGGSGNGWRVLLTWVVFIFATAVLGAANVGRRAIRALRAPLAVHGLAAPSAAASAGSAAGTAAGRLAATAGAALGAAAASPLVWASALSLRAGPTAGTSLASSPTDVVMLCAGIGIGLGIVLAFFSLTARPVATGVLVTAAWVWLVALASVGLSIADGRTPSVRLAMIDVPQLAGLAGWKLGPAVMIAVSAWLSLVVSAWGRWRPNRRWEIALSGLAGPALVAFAYVAAGPGTVRAPNQVEAYVTSMVCAGAALVVSTTIAVVSRRQPLSATPPAMPVGIPSGLTATVPRAAISSAAVPTPRAAPPPALPAGPPPAQLPSARASSASASAPVGAARASSTRVGLAPVSSPPVASLPSTGPAGTRPVSAPPVGAPAIQRAALAASATPAEVTRPPQIIYPDGARESARSAPVPTVAPPQVIEGKARPTPAPKRSAAPAKPKGGRAKKSGQPAAPPPPPAPEVPRLTPEEERGLRKRERDHIDWVRNLVSVPNSPELSQPRRRK